jgi:hypothetical protein
LSFLVDPPLLVATGAAAGRRVPMRRLAPPVLAVFWATGAALYRNTAISRPFMRLLPGRDGRDFMWTSGVVPVPHAKRRQRAKWDRRALAIFATYPFFLWLGTRAAR